VDVDFCREAIANNQKTLYAFTKQYAPLLEQIFTQKEIEAVVDSSGLNKHLIVGGVMKRAAKNTLFSEAFIKQAILDSPGLLTVALESEYKHLVNEILDTGDWPPSQVGDRPADIKEGVKRLMGSNTQVFNDWHKAYVLSFGIEKVVNAMKGPKTLPLLETFYTREEIRPHLSGLQGQKAKGRWLEEELGI
jgi:hypothetical protein